MRYFRDLDAAEEAVQNACLRALKTWPANGPPRDPAAWLILVGRNLAVDTLRRQARQVPLPDEEIISDVDDAEAALVERVDEAHYRDDILRLLFVCCHPDLPATQQIALALRVICGLTVKEIARAFLVTESAVEQRITRAKRRVAEARVPYEAPGAVERAERLAAVAAVIYLIFNEGYAASGGEVHVRAPLCEEAIRLARLLLRLFPAEPEIMGLAAMLLLQHARTAARLDADGAIVLLEDQDRGRWDRAMIAEGLALLDKAMRHRRPGPYQVQAAIAALHARAVRPEETDWNEIDALYAALERMQPSPVVTLNRAVAVVEGERRRPGARHDRVRWRRSFPAISIISASGARSCCNSAAARRPRSRSTRPSPAPIRWPRPPTSACSSIGWSRTIRRPAPGRPTAACLDSGPRQNQPSIRQGAPDAKDHPVPVV